MSQVREKQTAPKPRPKLQELEPERAPAARAGDKALGGAKPLAERKKRGAGRKRLSPEERRETFIEEAVEFFASEGFDGGTRDLANRLGVSQPLLYRYFPSKDDLIKEVYRVVYLERWRSEWDDLLVDRSRPLRERLQDFYEAYTDAIFTREWIRIYLHSGLKGVDINRWYVQVVEERILSRLVIEYRIESGVPTAGAPTPTEIELAWVLHGGIFYYGVRKHLFESDVHENKARVIANALDVFFEGLKGVFGTEVGGASGRAKIRVASGAR